MVVAAALGNRTSAVEPLAEIEIRTRLRDMRAAFGDEGVPQEGAPSAYRYVHPTPERADALLEDLSATEGITLGLPAIDLLTGGFRPKRLVLIQGFSHSCKTQLVNQMILHNPDKRILFFTLDDPAEMILAKLVAMKTGVSADTLGKRIREGDEETKQTVRDAAQEDFKNLLLNDDSLHVDQMKAACLEAEAYFGGPLDAVIVDYLESIPGARQGDDAVEGVKKMAGLLKAWALTCDHYPLIVVHQTTRSNGKPGKRVTLISGAYGGEQQASIGIGCWRKAMDAEALEADARLHQDTVTVNVFKNKQPGRKAHLEGIDFFLESETGLIRTLRDGDLGRYSSSASAARHVSPPVVAQTLEGVS
jgi:hypothetical protein